MLAPEAEIDPALAAILEYKVGNATTGWSSTMEKRLIELSKEHGVDYMPVRVDADEDDEEEGEEEEVGAHYTWLQAWEVIRSFSFLSWLFPANIIGISMQRDTACC